MDLLKLIKQRVSSRKYKKKIVPKKITRKILEAGIWGPSIHHFQPWKFVTVEKHSIIKKIEKIVSKKLKKISIPAFIYFPTIAALSNAQLMICVYNTKTFTAFSKKFSKNYFKNAAIAEISAISASIQNMTLVAESLGIGSCWLDLPLFCTKEINKLLNTKEELVAVLTLGYPEKKGKRSPRRPMSETVKNIK